MTFLLGTLTSLMVIYLKELEKKIESKNGLNTEESKDVALALAEAVMVVAVGLLLVVLLQQ